MKKYLDRKRKTSKRRRVRIEDSFSDLNVYEMRGERFRRVKPRQRIQERVVNRFTLDGRICNKGKTQDHDQFQPTFKVGYKPEHYGGV